MGLPGLTRGQADGRYSRRRTLPLKSLSKMLLGTPVKVTVLGDSVLQGSTAGTPGTNDAVSLLCAGLASRFGVTVTKDNKANGGRTMWWQMVEALDAAITANADVYVLGLTGKNDGAYEISSGIAKYLGQKRAASLAMVESTIRILRSRRPDADIILFSGNPYGSAATTANTNQKAYTQGLARLAAHYGLPYADGWNATVVSGQMYAADSDLYEAPSSGVHPNTSGHAKLGAALLGLFPASFDPGLNPASPMLTLPERVYKNKHAIGVKQLTGHATTAYADRVLTPSLNSGAWTGTGPWTTSTSGDLLMAKAKCTDFSIRFTYGAGQGTVDILLDGQVFASAMDLSTITDADQWFSIPDLSPGVHTVVVRQASGTVTVERFGFTPAASEFIDIRDTRVTLANMGAANDTNPFWGIHSNQIANTATITVPFIGTGLSMEAARSATGSGFYFSGVTVDGVAVTSIVGSNFPTGFGGAGLAGIGSLDVVSGLEYGYHVAVLTAQAAGLYVSGFSALDERPEAHLDVCSGVAKVGETVRPALPFTEIPDVRATSTTANAASVVSAATDSFVLAGTSGDVTRWSARALRRVLY